MASLDLPFRSLPSLDDLPFRSLPSECFMNLNPYSHDQNQPIDPSIFTVEFHFKVVNLWGVGLENGQLVLVKESEESVSFETLKIDKTLFALPHESHVKLSEKLTLLQIPDEYQPEMIHRISNMATEMIASDWLCLSAEILVQHIFFYDERAAISYAVQESTNEDGFGATPASKSSIDSLKSNTVRESDGGDLINGRTSCTVCLDEICVGSLVTEMPCSHIFHKDCIIQWLKTSHVCPICRFQMPIS